MIDPQSRLFTLLLGVLTMTTALAIDMSLPTLPTLARVFATTPDRAQLTLSLFLLGYAGGQLIMGPLSDRFGRRPVLLGGLVLYTAASFVCAVAPSIALLVAARLLQGIGGCIGPVLSRAVVRDHFTGPRAGQMLSTMTMVTAFAPLLAPLLGGWLQHLFGWPSIFVCLTAVGLILLVLTVFTFGESLRQPDLQALQPTRLLANYRAFFGSRISLGYGLVNAIAFCGTFSFISSSPFIFITVYGVPSTLFGFYFAAPAMGLMAGSYVGGRAVRRYGNVAVLRAGLVVMMTAAGLMLIVAATRFGGPVGFILPMILYAASIAIVTPNGMVLAMEPLPHMAGSAAALMGAMQMALASLAGYIAAALFDGTPMPMAEMLAAMASLSTGIYLFGVRRRTPVRKKP